MYVMKFDEGRGYTDSEIQAWRLNYETMLRFHGERRLSGLAAGSFTGYAIVLSIESFNITGYETMLIFSFH